ncbi:hypothetical protein GGI20_002432 [Coemansia sp. BCRC 34301]|nr:hypothetical protein GGI20_002432 [Coemansia sp. BCRC 34301]
MATTGVTHSLEQAPQKPRLASSGHLSNIGSSAAERSDRARLEAPSLSKGKIIRIPETYHVYFHNLVLLVIQCLKALPATSTPRDNCRLLLPYKGPRDFKPLDSTETFKLDQALFIRQWEDDIGDGVSEFCITDMLAVMEAKQAESDLVVNRASGMASHNRMFAWGLTVRESLLQVHLFGLDCILSSGNLNIRAPVGYKKFIKWLVSMCLGEDVRRGFMSSMRLVDDTVNGRDKCCEISVPAADNDGTAKSQVFCSRGPTVHFWLVYAGLSGIASACLANIFSGGTPDMFIKLAWQFADRGPGPCRKSEMEHLKVISDKYASANWPDVRVPKPVAGAMATFLGKRSKLVELTTDAIYGADIVEKFGIVDALSGSADADGSQRNTSPQKLLQADLYKRFGCSSVDSQF